MTASAIAPLPPGKLPVESSRPAQAIVESACEFVTQKKQLLKFDDFSTAE